MSTRFTWQDAESTCGTETGRAASGGKAGAPGARGTARLWKAAAGPTAAASRTPTTTTRRIVARQRRQTSGLGRDRSPLARSGFPSPTAGRAARGVLARAWRGDSEGPGGSRWGQTRTPTLKSLRLRHGMLRLQRWPGAGANWEGASKRRPCLTAGHHADRTRSRRRREGKESKDDLPRCAQVSPPGVAEHAIPPRRG